MFNVKRILKPAELHYRSPGAAATPTFENAKSVFVGKNVLVNLYAFNSSGAQVYLAVVDTPDTTIASGTNTTIYPIPATSFVSIATPDGDRVEGGLFLKAFTDVALTTPAGAVMHYKVDWTPYIAFTQ